MHPKYADRMANSVDPDQTAPLGAVWSSDCSSRSSLIWVYTVCPDLSVRKLRTLWYLYITILNISLSSCVNHFQESRNTISFFIDKAEVIRSPTNVCADGRVYSADLTWLNDLTRTDIKGNYKCFSGVKYHVRSQFPATKLGHCSQNNGIDVLWEAVPDWLVSQASYFLVQSVMT